MAVDVLAGEAVKSLLSCYNYSLKELLDMTVVINYQ